MPVYLVSYAKRTSTVQADFNHFVGLKTPKYNDFDQFWKFKFHFEQFPRNTRFLSFDWSINYLYLFKNHRQTFSWAGECPSSHLKVTKMWFGPNIKYLLETVFADFCCREGISFILSNNIQHSNLKIFVNDLEKVFLKLNRCGSSLHDVVTFVNDCF